MPPSGYYDHALVDWPTYPLQDPIRWRPSRRPRTEASTRRADDRKKGVDTQARYRRVGTSEACPPPSYRVGTARRTRLCPPYVLRYNSKLRKRSSRINLLRLACRRPVRQGGSNRKCRRARAGACGGDPAGISGRSNPYHWLTGWEASLRCSAALSCLVAA